MMAELMADLTLNNIETIRRDLMYVDTNSKEYKVIMNKLDNMYSVIKNPYYPKIDGNYVYCGRCEKELNNTMSKIPQAKFCPYCGNKFKEENGELCK